MKRSVIAVLCLALVPAVSFAQAPKTWREPGKSFLCTGGHPRCETAPGQYRYPQFAGQPGITDFAGVSDLLGPGPPLVQHHAFLAELQTYRKDTNAVGLWSDAFARADKTRVWGAFTSARSQLDKGLDAQLIGQEIDVLNDGKPGVSPNQSKVGLQIVGFGAENTNAIEILAQSPTSGPFSNGVMFEPTAIAPEGAYIAAIAQHPVARGIDFRNVKFTDGALMLGQKSAVTLQNKDGPASAILTDDDNRLVLRAGQGGVRIVSADSKRDLFTVTGDGDILTSRGPLLQSQGRTHLLLPTLLALSVLVNLLCLWRLFGAAGPNRPAAP